LPSAVGNEAGNWACEGRALGPMRARARIGIPSLREGRKSNPYPAIPPKRGSPEAGGRAIPGRGSRWALVSPFFVALGQGLCGLAQDEPAQWRHKQTELRSVQGER